MIEALGIWLKEIIILILIATFMEMILPGKSMQRYVKVVISLFILLTILKPIVSFLQSDYQVDSIFAAAAESGASAESSMQPLQGILQSGEQVRSSQEQQVMLLLEQRVGQMMQEQLQEQFPVVVQHITVKAALLENGDPALVRIDADILPTAPTAASDGAAGGRSSRSQHLVEPIRPVTVNVKVGESTPAEAAERETTSQAEKKLKAEITDWLSAHWDISGAKVSIHVQETKN